MRLADEYLRHGAPAAGFLFHLAARVAIHEYVDLLDRCALLLQEMLRAHAIGADRRGVDGDFGHDAHSDSQQTYIVTAAARTTRASVRTSTLRAPDRFRVRAQADTVAPVVNTSSISSTVRPLTASARFGAIRNAPRTLRRRALADGISPWLGVGRIRSSTRGSAVLPVSFASRCAIRADWLKRRDHRRRRCSGTGTRISASARRSRPARSSQRAKAGTRSSRSARLSARIGFLLASS